MLQMLDKIYKSRTQLVRRLSLFATAIILVLALFIASIDLHKNRPEAQLSLDTFSLEQTLIFRSNAFTATCNDAPSKSNSKSRSSSSNQMLASYLVRKEVFHTLQPNGFFRTSVTLGPQLISCCV